MNARARGDLPRTVAMLILGGLAGCGERIPEQLEVAALGSTGTGGEGQHAVAASLARSREARGLDIVLLLGDNFRPEGVASADDPRWDTQFLDVYVELPVPFRPVPGDRDHDGNIDAQMTWDGDRRWDMPGRYYRFRRELAADAAVEFFAVDTTRLKDRDDPDTMQLAWLREALGDSTARWRIVYGHHGILRISGKQDRALAASLLPLLHEHHVDAYLSGREHVLAMETDEAGLLHVTSGAGSMISDPRPSPAIQCVVPRQGFAQLSISGSALVVQLIDRDGRERCRHRVEKETVVAGETGS